MLIPHYMTRLEADIALEDLLLEQCEIVYGKKEAKNAVHRRIMRGVMKARRDIKIVGQILMGAEDVPTNNK